jgi:hypothetical protein
MNIADVTFLMIVGILAILSTGAIFIWRGIIWLSFISGVMWLLLGFYFITKTQAGTELLAFQEYIQVIFLGIGLAMFFSPMWLKQAKNPNILEKDAPNDINIWGSDEKYNNEDLREFGIKPKGGTDINHEKDI